jgi:hypothetical protein
LLHLRDRAKKSGPIAGATFQRGQGGGLSGKAMEAAVPHGGAVLREKLNRESSEGHCCGFYGLFSYFQKKHLPNQIRQQSAARSGNP